MSFQLFKAEILGNLQTQHSSKTKTAIVIGTAYNNLVQRMIEPLCGGVMFYTLIPKTPALIAGLQSVFTQNLLTAKKRVNIFQQFAPHIYTYWTGATTVGPLGNVTLTSTGVFNGPFLPETTDPNLWLDVLCAVCSTHIKTLVGIYINSTTGASSPWSGSVLMVI